MVYTIGFVVNLTVFPESDANVPDANLKTVFPDASLPAGLPSFIRTAGVETRLASDRRKRWR